jgi:hypothetical protein
VNYLAQTSVPIGKEFGSPFGQSVGVGSLVSTVISVSLFLAGTIMLFLLVLGGIGVIAGAGGDNPERAAKGKQAVTSAIIGFIIIIVAYWIIQIIENITGITILSVTF